jgi:diacylglycerol O-acyltransferase
MSDKRMPDADKSVKFDDFMSQSDTAIWVGERDPRLRSTIVSVWVLDRMPDEGDFEDMLAESVDAIPRLRQRVVRDRFEIAPPRWEIDPHFDPRFHLRKLHLGGQGTLRGLLDVAEPIAMQAFDKDRPLWEFYLIDGMENGQAGVIMKLHHAVSDGVGLVNMTKSMVEKKPGDAKERRNTRSLSDLPKPEARTQNELVTDALAHRVEVGRNNVRRFWSGAAEVFSELVRDPSKTVAKARDMVGSVQRLLEPIKEPKSSVMRERGMALSLSAFSIPLEDIKLASRAMNGSVNDVFVTAVAGGMRRYHEHFGKPVDELNMMMPINLRGTGEDSKKAGNQFAPARLLVPIGIEDPQECLEEIQRRVREERDELALGYLDDIMGVMNQLPDTLMDRMMEGMTTAVDFVTSNVPGPRRPTYTSGARIVHMFPFGPPAGAAVNVTLFSYDGTCHIGINADRAAVSEPLLLRECIEKSLADMLSDGRLATHTADAAPTETPN